jgi:hypothetical protein
MSGIEVLKGGNYYEGEYDLVDLAQRVERIEEVLYTLLPIIGEIVKERKQNN